MPEPVGEARARAMWAADAASRGLGMELLEARPGYSRVSMEVTGAMTNGHDICHGGFVFALADSAFAVACNTYDLPTVAAGADIVFIAAVGRGDRLVAEGVERVRYGRSGVYDVTVRRGEEVVAEFRGRARSLG